MFLICFFPCKYQTKQHDGGVRQDSAREGPGIQESGGRTQGTSVRFLSGGKAEDFE